MDSMNDGQVGGVIVMWVLIGIVALGLSMWVLYFVIRSAVLDALRQHTTSATWGVAVVRSVPVGLVSNDQQVESPEGSSQS